MFHRQGADSDRNFDLFIVVAVFAYPDFLTEPVDHLVDDTRVRDKFHLFRFKRNVSADRLALYDNSIPFRDFLCSNITLEAFRPILD